jgi:hypothetical protein
MFAVVTGREGDNGEGGGGGKGQMSGIKWTASTLAASDSGVGAVNTPTSEGCTRYPGGFNVVINLLLLLIPSTRTFIFRGGERDFDRAYVSLPPTALVEAVTENMAAFIYAVWNPLASSTKLDTPRLTRSPRLDLALPLALNVNAPFDSVVDSSSWSLASDSGKLSGQSASETGVSRLDAHE